MKYCYIVFIQNKTSKKLTDKSNTITCKNLLLRSGLFVWELYIIYHKKLGLVSFHSLSILKDSKSGKFVPHFHITSCWPLIIRVKCLWLKQPPAYIEEFWWFMKNPWTWIAEKLYYAKLTKTCSIILSRCQDIPNKHVRFIDVSFTKHKKYIYRLTVKISIIKHKKS